VCARPLRRSKSDFYGDGAMGIEKLHELVGKRLVD